jgi:hypothetical protein
MMVFVFFFLLLQGQQESTFLISVSDPTLKKKQKNSLIKVGPTSIIPPLKV